MRKTLLALAAVVALSQPSFAGDFNSKEFGRTMATADSHMRHKAILALDGNDSKQLKMIYRVLEGRSGPYCDFHDRDAAIKTLAKVANSKAIADMAKKLKKHKNYLMRQALCTAFVKMNDRLDDREFAKQRFVQNELLGPKAKARYDDATDAAVTRWAIGWSAGGVAALALGFAIADFVVDF